MQGKNDLTYITPKGKSVVDYCLTFIDDLQYIKSCDVLRVKEILDSRPISHTPTCALRDHSVISMNIQINAYEFWKNSLSNSDNLNKQNQFLYRKKYNFNVIPNDFMDNDHVVNEVSAFIKKLLITYIADLFNSMKMKCQVNYKG